MLRTIISVLAIAGFVFLFKWNKTQGLRTYTAYYANKRKEFPWLNKWLNEWEQQNMFPAKLRETSSNRNILSVILFFAIMILANVFFGNNIIVLIIAVALAFLIAILIGRSTINPSGCTAEAGLTLECPSCHCPHSWVMLQKINTVENENKTTKRTTTTIKGGGGSGSDWGFGAGDYKSTSTQTTTTYTGKSDKDFKCLNCGKTEHNVYEMEWVDNYPDCNLQKFDPPKPAWEIPSGYVLQAAEKMYEQIQSEQEHSDNAASIEVTPELLKAAEMGNSDACYDLAAAYLLGLGVEKDKNKARELVEKAQKEKISDWRFSQGYYIYDVGVMVYASKKYSLAFQLFQMAVDAGVRDAFYRLGCCYEEGKGITQDKEKALNLYQKGMDLGDKENAKPAYNRLKKELK